MKFGNPRVGLPPSCYSPRSTGVPLISDLPNSVQPTRRDKCRGRELPNYSGSPVGFFHLSHSTPALLADLMPGNEWDSPDGRFLLR